MLPYKANRGSAASTADIAVDSDAYDAIMNLDRVAQGRRPAEWILSTLFGPGHSFGDQGPVVIKSALPTVAFATTATLQIPILANDPRQKKLLAVTNYTNNPQQLVQLYSWAEAETGILLPGVGTCSAVAISGRCLMHTMVSDVEGNTYGFSLAPPPTESGVTTRALATIVTAKTSGTPIADNQSVGMISAAQISTSQTNLGMSQNLAAYADKNCNVRQNVPAENGVIARQGAFIPAFQPPDSAHQVGDSPMVQTKVVTNVQLGQFSSIGSRAPADGVPSGKYWLSSTATLTGPNAVGVTNVPCNWELWQQPSIVIEGTHPGTASNCGNANDMFGSYDPVNKPNPDQFNGCRFAGYPRGSDRRVTIQVTATYVYSRIVNGVCEFINDTIVKREYAPPVPADTPPALLTAVATYCVSMTGRTSRDLDRCFAPTRVPSSANPNALANQTSPAAFVPRNAGVANWGPNQVEMTYGNVVPPPLGPTCYQAVPASAIVSYTQMFRFNIVIDPRANAQEDKHLLGVLVHLAVPMDDALAITGSGYMGVCTLGVPNANSNSTDCPNATVQWVSQAHVVTPYFHGGGAMAGSLTVTIPASVPGVGPWIRTQPSSDGNWFNQFLAPNSSTPNSNPLGAGVVLPVWVAATGQPLTNTNITPANFSYSGITGGVGAGNFVNSFNDGGFFSPAYTFPNDELAAALPPLLLPQLTSLTSATGSGGFPTYLAVANGFRMLSNGTGGIGEQFGAFPYIPTPPAAAGAFPQNLPVGVQVISVANQSSGSDVITGLNQVCQYPGPYYPSNTPQNVLSLCGYTDANGYSTSLSRATNATTNAPLNMNSNSDYPGGFFYLSGVNSGTRTTAGYGPRNGGCSSMWAGPYIGATSLSILTTAQNNAGLPYPYSADPKTTPEVNLMLPQNTWGAGNFPSQGYNSSVQAVTLPVCSPIGWQMDTTAALALPPQVNNSTALYNSWRNSTFTSGYCEPRAISMWSAVTVTSISIRLYGDPRGTCQVILPQAIGKENLLTISLATVIQSCPTAAIAPYAKGLAPQVPEVFGEAWNDMWMSNLLLAEVGNPMANIVTGFQNDTLRDEYKKGGWAALMRVIGLLRFANQETRMDASDAMQGAAWSFDSLLSSVGKIAGGVVRAGLPIAKQIAVSSLRNAIQGGELAGEACSSCMDDPEDRRRRRATKGSATGGGVLEDGYAAHATHANYRAPARYLPGSQSR